MDSILTFLMTHGLSLIASAALLALGVVVVMQRSAPRWGKVGAVVLIAFAVIPMLFFFGAASQLEWLTGLLGPVMFCALIAPIIIPIVLLMWAFGQPSRAARISSILACVVAGGLTVWLAPGSQFGFMYIPSIALLAGAAAFGVIRAILFLARVP